MAFLPPADHLIHLPWNHYYHWLQSSNTFVRFMLTSGKSWPSLFSCRACLHLGITSYAPPPQGKSLRPGRSILKEKVASMLLSATKSLFATFAQKGSTWKPNAKARFTAFSFPVCFLGFKFCFLPFSSYIHILENLLTKPIETNVYWALMRSLVPCWDLKIE